MIEINWTLTTTDPATGATAMSHLTNVDFTATQLTALEHIIRHRGETPRSPADRGTEDPPPKRNRVEQILEAKGQGYTGQFCTHCQSARTKNNGACLVCEDCGQTTGCS